MLEHKSQIGDQQNTEIQYLTNMASSLGNSSKMKYAEWFTRVIMPA